MTDLHPHWQSTDGAPQKRAIEPTHSTAHHIPVGTSEPTHRKRSLSRQPAAITGILLAVSIGSAVYIGWGGSTDVAHQRSTVVATSQATPSTDNRGTIGSTLRAALPDSASSEATNTTVDVFAPVQNSSSSVASSIPNLPSSEQSTDSKENSSSHPSGTLVASASSTSSVAPIAPQSSSTTEIANRANALIPTNPFTVGNTHATTTTPKGGTKKGIQEVLHNGAPLRTVQPISAPSTGPKEWVVVFATAGALMVVTRRQMRRTER